MKGIILAGGQGSRLYPLTKTISKHLLPIYDKPLIYYPLSTLMLAGIKDILIISDKENLPNYKKLLNDGNALGIKLSYAIQEKPRGIAEAFIIGEEFLNKSKCALILGDNIFYGNELKSILSRAKKFKCGSFIFLYPVENSENFGVANINKKNKIVSIVEKPLKPRSNFAITGLYFYDSQVSNIAKKIKPSKRGELEISSINQYYLKKNKLEHDVFGRGIAWLDTGTFDSLIDAGQFVRTIERRQGFKISCPEEISYRNGWLNKNEFKKLANKIKNKNYKNYLLGLLKNEFI